MEDQTPPTPSRQPRRSMDGVRSVDGFGRRPQPQPLTRPEAAPVAPPRPQNVTARSIASPPVYQPQGAPVPQLTTPAVPSEPLLPPPPAPRAARRQAPAAPPAGQQPVFGLPELPGVVPAGDPFAGIPQRAPRPRAAAPAPKRRGAAFLQGVVVVLIVLGVAMGIVWVYLHFYAA